MATPTIAWSYYTGAAWVAITSYVLMNNGVSGYWGMSSNKPNDRLARTGEMRMLLDNTNGCFDPDDADALTGWGKNTKIKLEVTFDGITWRRFYGTIQDIKFSDPSTFQHTASITVMGWMNYAYQFPLKDLSVAVDKTGDYAVDAIVDAVGKTPLATNYSAGEFVYDATFDSVTPSTKAATELNKIVQSELGYFYSKHDRVNGETLTFETQSDRNGLRALSKIPLMKADSGYILQAGSATDRVLDCAGNLIIANEVQDAHMNGIANFYSRSHGDNIINRVTITAYPKRTDGTEQTLYSLGSPLKILAGETKIVIAKYQNLSTKESCNAITSLMIQPVATTDYTMNKNEAGTSTNLTSDLAVTADYKTAEVRLTLVNSSIYTGYVRLLKCRGYGVYQDSSIVVEKEDTVSQNTYSESVLNIEQQYQRDTANSEPYAETTVENEKDPRTKLNEVTFIANKSDFEMLAFLNIDVGDLVKITETTLNLAHYYYVQGVKFSISGMDTITYSWILKESVNQVETMTPATIEFTSGNAHHIKYPAIQPINDAYILTWLFSVYIHVDPENNTPGDQIVGNTHTLADYGMGGQSIVYRQLAGSFYMELYSNDLDSAVSRGSLRTDPADLFSHDTWYRMGFVYNKVLQTGSIYVDGSPISSLANIGVGNLVTHSSNLRIGGIQTRPAIRGSVKNVRVHNVGLTAAEFTADNAGTFITRGLQFAGPYVRNGDVTYFTDHELVSTDRLFDVYKGYVGTPVSSGTYPTIRF